jgi:hypothetical protein
MNDNGANGEPAPGDNGERLHQGGDPFHGNQLGRDERRGAVPDGQPEQQQPIVPERVLPPEDNQRPERAIPPGGEQRPEDINVQNDNNQNNEQEALGNSPGPQQQEALGNNPGPQQQEALGNNPGLQQREALGNNPGPQQREALGNNPGLQRQGMPGNNPGFQHQGVFGNNPGLQNPLEADEDRLRAGQDVIQQNEWARLRRNLVQIPLPDLNLFGLGFPDQAQPNERNRDPRLRTAPHVNENATRQMMNRREEQRRGGYFPDMEFEQPLEQLINGVFQNYQHEPVPVLNAAQEVQNDDAGNPLMEQPQWNQNLSRVEMIHALREPIFEVERRAHEQRIQLRERYTQISQDVELLTHNFLLGTQRTNAFEGDVAYASINQRAMNDRFDAQLRRHHEDQRHIMDLIRNGVTQVNPVIRTQPQYRQQAPIPSANDSIGSVGANRLNVTGRGNTTRVGDQTLFESVGIQGMGSHDRDFKSGIEGILTKIPKAAAKKIQNLLDLTPIFEEIGANTKSLIRMEVEKVAGKHGAIMAQNQRKSLVNKKFLAKIKMNCRNIKEALEDVAIGIEDPLEKISRLKQCLYYMQTRYSQNDDRQENISEALFKLQHDNEVIEANRKKDSVSIVKLEPTAICNVESTRSLDHGS